jgi:hypothetical protein
MHVYTYMYMYMYMCMNIHIHASLHVHVHVYMYICTYHRKGDDGRCYWCLRHVKYWIKHRR